MASHPTNRPRKGVTPLDHMLAVMNDPTADPARKDRMARAAAPYCHPRVVDKGKRDWLAEAAERAGAGTPWAADLDDDWP